jgi:hypothetical protein
MMMHVKIYLKNGALLIHKQRLCKQMAVCDQKTIQLIDEALKVVFDLK